MPSAAGLYYFLHAEEKTARPPVVLMHGAGGTHLNWPPQVRRLDGQPMIAVDLPGHGKSEGVGRQLVSDYAADMLRFLDALKLPAAVFVGHSLGAAIALTLALESPGRVMALALLGGSAVLRVSPELLEAASRPSTFREAVHMVTEMGYSQYADPRLKELAEERTARTRPTVFYGDFLACDGFNVAGRLVQIRVPTLVLGASQDNLTPLWSSTRLADQIPGARLEVIHHAGHMRMLEKPEAVASALDSCFNSLPDRPGREG